MIRAKFAKGPKNILRQADLIYGKGALEHPKFLEAGIWTIQILALLLDLGFNWKQFSQRNLK